MIVFGPAPSFRWCLASVRHGSNVDIKNMCDIAQLGRGQGSLQVLMFAYIYSRLFHDLCSGLLFCI